MSLSGDQKKNTGVSGLAGRLSWLTLVMVSAGLLLISIGTLVLGTSVQVGLIGWAVCSVSALVAHVFGEYPRGPYNFAARMAVSMLVRTVVPFGVAVWALKIVQPPVETSLVFYILSFYVVGLVADVQLHVGRLRLEASHAEHLKT